MVLDKKALWFCAVLMQPIFVTPSVAQDSSGDVMVFALTKMQVEMYEASQTSFCKDYSANVGSLLDFRYQGKPIENFMKWANTKIGENETENLKDFRVNMVLTAYSAPRFSAPEMIEVQRQELITDFFLNCWRDFTALTGIADPRP